MPAEGESAPNSPASAPGKASARPPAPLRVAWLVFGFLCVGLGLIGVVLPLLPTAPFMLLAAYAFARSSPRMHDWLVQHPWFGPPIRNWRDHGAIQRGAKLAAAGSMAVVLAVSWWLQVPDGLLAVQAVVLIACATFVLTRPEPPPGNGA